MHNGLVTFVAARPSRMALSRVPILETNCVYSADMGDNKPIVVEDKQHRYHSIHMIDGSRTTPLVNVLDTNSWNNGEFGRYSIWTECIMRAYSPQIDLGNLSYYGNLKALKYQIGESWVVLAKSYQNGTNNGDFLHPHNPNISNMVPQGDYELVFGYTMSYYSPTAVGYFSTWSANQKLSYGTYDVGRERSDAIIYYQLTPIIQLYPNFKIDNRKIIN